MKKSIYFLHLLVFMLMGLKLHSQSPQITISPQIQCYSVNGNTSIAYPSVSVPGANSYSWTILSPVGSNCAASVSTFSNGGFVNINYPCCGTYTVICWALSGSVTIGTAYNTTTISCVNITTNVQPSSTICAGTTATVSASGASSYTWSTGSTGSSIVVSPSVSTCYTVTGSDAFGCIGSTLRCVHTITSSPVSIYGNANICQGSSTILHATGASNYTWFPGGSTSPSISVSPSVTTCYTLSGLGCGGIVSTVKCVTVGTTPSVTVTGNSNICAGTSATLNASGASSYTWYTTYGTFTGSTIAFSPTATTCYSLVGSNGPGCNVYTGGCVTVTTNSIAITGNGYACSGSPTILNAIGASNYTWFPVGSNSSSIVVTPSINTCYTVSGVGCGGIVSAVKCITVFAVPSVTILSGSSTVCAGSSTTLNVIGASSYTWYTNSGLFTGPTAVFTPTATTCYTLASSSGTGCTGYTYDCINVVPNNINISGNTNLCQGSSTTTVLHATGASNYTWFPGGSTSPSIAVSPSVTTCYTLSGIGCSGIISTVKCVTVGTTPSVTVTGNSTICAGSGATLTASGASSYIWYTSYGTFTGSTIAFSPTATTCYSLVASNGTGCNVYIGGCVNVTPNNINISGNTNLCLGSSTILHATGASNYTWFPGGSTSPSISVSPSVTTCYTLSGIGCNGIVSTVKCVTVGTSPVLTVSGNPTICAGSGATLTASGATSYTWYTSSGTFTGSTIVLSPTATTCYSLVGSNGPGCNSYSGGCVTVAPGGSIAVNGASNICSGSPTTLQASGASSYTWYPGSLTGSVITVSPLVNTCYTVFGSTGNCISSALKCLSVQSGPSLTVSGSNTICSGSSATLFANGASSYTWLPGNLTGAVVVVSPSVSTCYTVVGTQSTGCVGLGYKCVQLAPQPAITIGSTSIVCSGSPTYFSAQGASTYTWLPFNLTGSLIAVTPTASGCYTVLGTNGFGCTGAATSCYSVLPAPVITVAGTNSLCAGSSTTLSATGAGTFVWQPGNSVGASIVITPSASTCYTVTGYSNGCSYSAVKCVSVAPAANIYVSGANSICSGSSANLLAGGALSYTWNTGSNSPFITVTPSTSTCYTVSGTNANGCSGSVVKCIIVEPQPFVTISGPGSVCSGSGFSLVASGASSYSWNTGSMSNIIQTAISTSSVYTVVGSNGNCSGIASKTVIVNPLPTITISRTDSLSQDSILCAGTPVHLSATGANSYTWNTGALSPNTVVTPSTSASYTVFGTNSFGCTSGAAIYLNVSACTGIAEKYNTVPEVSLYPNPSSGKISLKNESQEEIRYHVYDLLGRELLKGKFTEHADIDLSGYANGSYVIGLEINGVYTHKKLILEKR